MTKELTNEGLTDEDARELNIKPMTKKERYRMSLKYKQQEEKGVYERDQAFKKQLNCKHEKYDVIPVPESQVGGRDDGYIDIHICKLCKKEL